MCHTDRRGNEITLMKCQLFKEQNDVCGYCAKNPPDNTAAFRNESKLGGFLYDPLPSTIYEGHYKTYLDLKKEECRYTPSASGDVGRCQICPNWHFSSKTEKERHNRLLHPNSVWRGFESHWFCWSGFEFAKTQLSILNH